MWHFVVFVAACLLPAFLISWVATAVIRKRAASWGLVDQPAARKVHVTPTPLGGGIAIWLGVLLPMLAAVAVAFLNRSASLPSWLPRELTVHLDGMLDRSGQLWAVLAGGTILAVMGLIDDLKNLPWLPRLLVQLCVAIALVSGGVRATLFVTPDWFGAACTVIWILVLINSFNFLDNMDGLSSGIALIAAVMFAVIMLSSTGEPRWFVGGLLLVLAGALAGFLCFNWSPASIFMGDSGAYFIGLIMACSTILGTFYDGNSSGRHVILAPLCILAIPLYDFCSVLVIRIMQRRKPWHPDKSHFSHRLVELGLKPRNAVLTIHLATLTTGIGALLLYQVRGWPGALLVVALIACVLLIVAILEYAGRKNNANG